MANAFGNAGWCGARTRSKRSLLIEIAVYLGAGYSANRTGDTKSIQHCEVRRYWAKSVRCARRGTKEIRHPGQLGAGADTEPVDKLIPGNEPSARTSIG